MSEAETLIAVAGTLGGSLGGILLGYILEAKREARRLRNETALGPLHQKREVLIEAYHSMVDLGLVITSSSATKPEDRAKVKEALHKYDVCNIRSALWLTGSQEGEFGNIFSSIRTAAEKVIEGEDLSDNDLNDLNDLRSALVKETVFIAKELNITVLRDQLREMFST